MDIMGRSYLLITFGSKRAKCFAQEHNASGRIWTSTSRHKVQHTNKYLWPLLLQFYFFTSSVCVISHQVLVIIDAKPKDLGLPTDAYVAVEEVHDVSFTTLQSQDWNLFSGKFGKFGVASANIKALTTHITFISVLNIIRMEHPQQKHLSTLRVK